MEKIRERLTSILPLLAILLIWVLMVILVNPVGDFPLNDDWAYARPVKSLIEKGSLQFTGWQTVTLIAHVFWGALFCLPFGFSFTTLRLSTLLLGLVGALATYGLLREVKASRTIALIGTLTVLTNPLYFQLSNTFMTDIPFFAFSILSFLFLTRGIKRGKKTDILIGTLIACVATLTRQFGIIIPLSFGTAYLFKNGINKKTIRTALMPTILVIGTLIFYLWLQSVFGLSGSKILEVQAIGKLTGGFYRLTRFMTINLLNGFIYLGLFLLSFLMIMAPNIWKTLCYRKRVWVYIAFSLFFIGAGGELFLTNKLMPLLGNILFDIGLGPVTLRDVSIFKFSHWPNASKILWIVITVAGLVGAASLVALIVLVFLGLLSTNRNEEYRAKNWIIIFMASACVLYFGLITITILFDRYLIFLLPILMVIVVRILLETTTFHHIKIRLSSLSTIMAIGFIVFYGFFSVGATHDYLSWNQARWKALDYLKKEAHISPFDIDGGLEFNGLYKFPTKKWIWDKNNDYIITLGPITGYKEITQYSFERWIPCGQGSIFVLRKLADPKN